MTGDMELVGIAAVRAAAARIRTAVQLTPLLPVDPSVGQPPGGAPDLWMKCECLQFAGAFKLRGAFNFIASLDPEARSGGVITYSSGNHAQGVAYAARLFGIGATVVMPVDAPEIKVAAVQRLGAELEQVGTTTLERKARAEEILAARGGTMVPPFDHPDIIAGQGTVGLEIVQQLAAAAERKGVRSEIGSVLVPVGGGGLLSGVAVVMRALAPDARVIGVEPEGAAKMSASLEAGHPVTLDGIDTVADGLKPVRPGDLTFAHTRALVDRIVTVTDAAIREATVWCYRQRLVVEPSGAAAIAALASGRIDAPESGATVAVLSGGNLDPAVCRAWLAASGG